MMKDGELVMVDGEWHSACGLLVYWSLTGRSYMAEIVDALKQVGLDPDKYAPNPPSAEIVAYRAAQACIHGKREMVRPLSKRGTYMFVTEVLVDDKPTYEHQVRVSTDGDNIVVEPQWVGAAVPSVNEEKAWAINREFKSLRDVLLTDDISAWLLHILDFDIRAVSLRDRGGIYFVPADKVEMWRMFVKALRLSTGHSLYEIPAMKTDEAVEAVLSAVRREVDTKMQAFETYLTGDKVSTKGLNAIERDLDDLRLKVAHYTELLGVSLPDLEEKNTRLMGACTAARLTMMSERNAQV